MDTGSWQATVHEVAKESDTTENIQSSFRISQDLENYKDFINLSGLIFGVLILSLLIWE